MFLITITAVAAVCGAAKLDRAYLPPPLTAKFAGGSPGSLQTPFIGNSINQRIGGIPKGGYTNDFEGVVVEAVAPGTRASSPDDTNLGAPRITYGSIYSKVGGEAFKLDPVDEIRYFSKDSHVGLNEASVTENGKQDFRNINNMPNSEAIKRTQAAQDRLAETIQSENEIGPNNYKYSFETNNGIVVQENAIESEGVQAIGHFAYKADDGQIYSVTYTADSNGYKPVGDHIPTPPPIPKEILKSLEQNARDEAAGLVDDGSYDAQKYNTGGDYNQRSEANGQYNVKQLLNTEQRPELLTNGEALDQNNRHFGSQKLTEVQFELNKNLYRPNTENNKQNQYKQDNFNYANRYTPNINSQKDLQFNSHPNFFNKAPELGLKGNQFLENYRTEETHDSGFRNSNKGNILSSQNYQTQSQYDRTSQLSNNKIKDFQNIPRNQYKPNLPQTAHNQNFHLFSLKGDSYHNNPTLTSLSILQDQHTKSDIGSNSKTQFTGQNFPLTIKENYQGSILQSPINGITQASALPLNSRLQTFSTLPSNHLGMQQIQKDSGTVSLQSHKFLLKQHVGQGLPQIQPNYSQETIVPNMKYTGELYQYNKPPESMPAPSNTDSNSKFTGELYVYNKPPETSSSDKKQKQSVHLSQAKDVHLSIPNTQVHKPTSLLIPTTSQRVSEKLTLENGSHETHRQQCCQESYNSHKDLSQSPIKTENQGFSSQYQIPGQSFVRQGEVFSEPREIPRFDSTGYHY